MFAVIAVTLLTNLKHVAKLQIGLFNATASILCTFAKYRAVVFSAAYIRKYYYQSKYQNCAIGCIESWEKCGIILSKIIKDVSIYIVRIL